MATTPAGAKRTVTVSLLVAGGLVTIRDVAKGQAPSVKLGLGVAASGIFLALMAEGSPGLAKGFALLLLFASIFAVGGDAFNTLSKRFGS